jgi:hypothetical protein
MLGNFGFALASCGMEEGSVFLARMDFSAWFSPSDGKELGGARGNVSLYSDVLVKAK